MQGNLVFEYLDFKMNQELNKWNLRAWEQELEILVQKTVEYSIPSKYEFSLHETAEIMGVTISTIQKSEEDGLVKTEKCNDNSIVTGKELTRIFTEQISSLSHNQALFLLQNHGLSISRRDFNKK